MKGVSNAGSDSRTTVAPRSTIRRQAATPEMWAKDDPGVPLDGRLSLAEAVDAFERTLVEKALLEANGVQSKAAQLLGTTRRIIKYRMEKLNISTP